EDDRNLVEALLLHLLEEVTCQVEMSAAQDAQAHEMDAFVGCGASELLRRDADPLVDDLEPRITRAERDLLGAVGVAVEARAADEELRAAAELLLEGDDALAQRLERGRIPGHGAGARDARRSAVFAEGFAERRAPLPGREPRLRRSDGRGHHVLAGLRG